ncbi:hypothetical protein [Gorillibacterium sp. CAU 1737]|uniref:hypothetical protein n=1 Tax=Gorillibacterium sp. CAU 1737 TaxID=3140362 RepID=UPI003261A331
MAESYLQRRARELGVNLPGSSSSTGNTSETYLQRRARELGVNLNPTQAQAPTSSALERRRMDLGITPETRPERLQAQSVAQNSMFNVAGATDRLKQQNDARKSAQVAPIAQNSVSNLAQGNIPNITRNKSTVQKVLDTIQYPFDKAAEALAPSGAFLDGQPDEYGAINPRDRLVAQHAEAGRATTGNETLDKIGTFLGETGAFFANPAKVPNIAAIYNNPLSRKAGDKVGSLIAGDAAGKLATSGKDRFFQIAGRAGNEAVREGLTGAVQGAQYGLTTGTGDVRDVAREAVMGGATGLLGGAALGTAGGAARNILDNRAARNEILGAIDNAELPVNRNERLVQQAADTGVKRQNDLTYSLNRSEAPATQSIQADVNRPLVSPQASAARPTVARGEQERGFISTLKASDKMPDSVKASLTGTYKPITNEATVSAANMRIDSDLERAAAFVMGDSAPTAEKVTTGLRLIDEFTKKGNHERAVTIAEKLAEEGTKAGQSIQAFSIYNRLDPQGMLIHATRVADKVNKKLPRGAKEVKITPEMSANITDLAQTTQSMTGVKTLANDVMNILDRAKAGEKLSATDADSLKRFVNEAKQFVDEVKKPVRESKPPTLPKDKRVRDNVVSFLDAQEQAAKERLRARGIRVSSTPLDVWADYAVIGAAKLAKGTIKFADWSEQMIKDLGEEIRPQLAKLYERSKEALNVSTKKVSQEQVSNAERLTERVIKSKELDETTATNLRTLARQVSKLSGEAKVQASQDLQVILQQLDKPGIGKRLSSAQTVGQLLNPKTQVRNAVGNELFYRIERLNKLVATPIDIARSKITGSERTVTFRTNNQGEYWKNFISGGRAGWKGVNVNGLETQFDLQGQAFRSKWNPLTYLEKATGAALRSFDNAAYMRAVNHTVGEMATLRAINEGLEGEARKAAIKKYIREADENILGIADEYGKYVTFQDNNAISKGLQSLKKGLNANRSFGLGDLILKYPKTPGAIVMRSLEYSPAGFLRSAKIAAEPWLRKSAEANPREAVQALSRAIIGTVGMSGLGYFMLDKGIITGSASKDKDIRDLQRSAGQGQYQVNLSALKRWVESGFNPDSATLRKGDNLYTYDWAQPLAIAVSMGANAAKNVNENKGATSGIAGTAYDSFSGGLNTLVEQSVLSGLKDAAQGYPGQTVTDKIVDVLSDLPSSFVPTLANQIKQVTDNRKRETYDPDKIQQSLKLAKSRIPGVADQFPQQTDTLGRPKTTYQDNSVFNVFFNPGFSSKYELSPEAEMIVDLINKTGDETLAPRVPSKKLDGTALTNEQFARLQQLQGEETAKRLQRINRNATTESQAKQVKKALTTAGEQARKQLKKEFNIK